MGGRGGERGLRVEAGAEGMTVPKHAMYLCRSALAESSSGMCVLLGTFMVFFYYC